MNLTATTLKMAVQHKPGVTAQSCRASPSKSWLHVLWQLNWACSHCCPPNEFALSAGTVLTATAHVITTVIGSGILSLTWAISTMGWVAGPVLLLAFAAVTWYTSLLLTDAYRHPKGSGPRNRTYPEAVHAILGMHTLIQYSYIRSARHVQHERRCMPQGADSLSHAYVVLHFLFLRKLIADILKDEACPQCMQVASGGGFVPLSNTPKLW